MRLSGRWVFAVSVVPCGAVLILATFGFLIAWHGIRATPERAQMAVIFGTAVGADNRPKPALEARLERGLALWRQGAVQVVMVSGAVETVGHRDEARIMAEWLIAHQVPASAIITDSHGNNTWLTALHVAAMHPRSAVVVTQWFHVPRAEWSLRRAGTLDVSGAGALKFRAAELWYLFRESVALPVYMLTKSPPRKPVG